MTKTATPSRYDDLLDRYHTIASKKAGTRYEVLAAMVCKTLEEAGKVIHDVKLRGGSGVFHQIDVSVESGGATRRYLIECKDFDNRAGKVNLGIVRDFESAMRDIGADEAWIVTCIGFTSEALKYAKAKGIKPVVMRLFEDRDRAGRIERIVLNIHLTTPAEPVANIYVTEDNAAVLEEARRKAGLTGGSMPGDDAYFQMPDGTRHHLNEVLTAAMNEAMGDHRDGVARCVFQPEARKLLIGGMEVPYEGIIIDFQILTETKTSEIVSSRIAELIVEGLKDADIVIFDDQIRRRKIAPDTGEIT